MAIATMKESVMKFQPKSDAERRVRRLVIRLTNDEHETIAESAAIRALDVSGFVRRAALGKKADVQYEYKLIYEMRELGEVLHDIHKSILDTGNAPPEEIMREALFSIVGAMNRISK
jgi:uncharacterized protein (DUF1778 family)